LLFERPGYVIQWFDENGRRRKESIRCGDLDTAKRIAAELEKAVLLREKGIIDTAQERYAAERRRPLAEHLADFERFLTDQKRTPKHVAMTCQHIRRVAELCGAKALPHLTGPAVMHAVGELRVDDQPDSSPVPASPRTRNAYLGSVRAFTR